MVRIVTIFAMIASTANAFSGSSFTGASSRVAFGVSSSPSRLSMAVVDIDSEAKFDKTIESAGDSLVVVDYSTTWCGPCKVIAPKFDELSEQYSDAVFVKVIGDASPDASKLMKREGVRSVPSFHYFKGGEKVEVVNGANAEAIEAAITKHL
uniref:Thioredoxin domain-containing protein n=1 Tax=Ditylum brightwellii TaxID=49249 RepID=A0A6S9BEG3_9STRA|mmetsp:Transcript_17669/g.23391  ORF Transcript_17669/g.23391 Transcript_17669/m.23391 type:complete len:152 (+) Transcript_17669:235-690(+)